jgi:hypothetical protein
MRTVLIALAIAGWPAAAFASPFLIHPYNLFGSEDEFTASVNLGDLDNDGNLDGFAVNGRHWIQQDRVYFNNGMGFFRTSRPAGAVEGTGYTAALADFDGDGDLDAVVARDLLPSLYLENDGTGRFSDGEAFGPVTQARSSFAGDLDGDGDADLVISQRGDVNFLFLNENGFGDPVTLDGEYQTIGGTMADIDEDGDLDLVFSNRGGQGLLVYVNDGAAGFGEPVFIGAGDQLETRSLAVGDLNDDGHADLVVAVIGGANAIYHGDGAGGFTLGERFGTAEDGVYGIALADFDNDGQTDIVTAHTGTPSAVWLRDGDGFERITLYDEAVAAYGVAIGDLDMDGRPDLVFAVSENVNFVALNRIDPDGD